MIEVKGINKSFGTISVLKDVELQVKKSEILGITGASGAGKTTLLQIMGTLLKPDSGEVRMNGSSVFKMKEKEISKFRNNHIGFVFQFHHLLPEFNCFENVCIPAYIGKRNRSEIESRAIELLSFLKMDHRLNHKPSELSGGELQRIAIARALINNPMVVFADEPSGNLDQDNTEELHRLILDLRNKYKQTFIIVSHDRQLSSKCDRSIHLVDGKIEKQ
jgi:lipoprotein-releasing system ATP-binding protein